MIDGAFASASSTVCPSTPGAPLLRTTFNSARARLASDATSSSSRLLSTTPGPGPLVFLLLALCSRKPRRSDASEGLVVPPPEGLSANTRLNCRGPVFLNPSLPLLDRLSPASLLIRRDPTSAWASTRRRCLLQVYRSRGPTQISLGKNTGCPAAPAPITASASVGFWASRSMPRFASGFFPTPPRGASRLPSHDVAPLRAVASGSRLLPTRPAKDLHLQSSAHARHTFDCPRPTTPA